MLFFSRYEVFESDSDSRKEPPEDFLDRFEGEMLGSDRMLSLLTALGVKPASDVEGFFNSKQRFENFISIMNSAGLNCYVEFDPSETEVESMKGLFEEEGGDISFTEDFEVKVRIFITRKEYSTGFFLRMKFYKKIYRLKYHRMYGGFLEFREKDIEAFIEGQKPFWIPSNDSVKEGLRPEQLAEKYGDDFSEEDLKAFEALHFGILQDSRKRFYDGIEEMEERKNILEESSFDADEVIEEKSFQ